MEEKIKGTRIGVCGIACEICPLMKMEKCPNGKKGCIPKENRFCGIATCANRKKVDYCFVCQEFPCETTKSGPIHYDYCIFISGKA
ncbi:MAG: DUF3795 domain-containing protein [Methanomassiliicoccales archaeon]|nr:DUF3795 domain-containing protein [Methanomassiliicoccales archaeon]